MNGNYVPRGKRGDVLAEVNRVFRQHGLPLWTLENIGLQSKGEFEITGVDSVQMDLWSAFITVKFHVVRPDGSNGTYVVEISKPAVYVVPVINGQMVLVKQHRVALGKWTVELPRGWIDTADAEDVIAGARKLMEREVGAAWVASWQAETWTKLAHVAEDTGRRASRATVLLVEATTTMPLPKRCGVHKPMSVSSSAIEQMVDDEVIGDQASLSALLHYERLLRRRARLEAENSNGS